VFRFYFKEATFHLLVFVKKINKKEFHFNTSFQSILLFDVIFDSPKNKKKPNFLSPFKVIFFANTSL
jgi:hypothetical protein